MQGLTETEWARINNCFPDMEVLRSSACVYLASDFDELTIGGKNCSDKLPQVYCLATENATDKAVTSFICAVDNDEIFEQLADSDIFLGEAAKQKKKTDFKACMKSEKLRRKKEHKRAQEQKDLQSREESLADKPPFYGAELSRKVVEEILDYCGFNVRLNLVTRKTELYGAGAEAYFKIHSLENLMSTLPQELLDICKENCVTNGKNGVTSKHLSAYLFNIADRNRYNPITDMLKEHQNENESNLDTVYEILGVRDSIQQTLIRKWLIQTVAFAFASERNYVCAEGVLVLQGRQGNGKTSFFRKLAVKPEWFTEGTVVDMRVKDSIITATSCWICELGEIDCTLQKEQSALKAFITRSDDRIRLPYASAESVFPRTTSLCGTVNPEKFLKDMTGNRRYWTVHVDEIDKKRLHSLTEREVCDVWGYIYHLYLQNKNGFRLTESEARKLDLGNFEFRTELKYEQEVRELLDFTLDESKWGWYTPTMVAGYISPNTRAEAVGKVLNRIHEEEPVLIKKRHKYTGNEYYLPLQAIKIS